MGARIESRKPIEMTIFSWEDWEEADEPGVFIYTTVSLIANVYIPAMGMNHARYLYAGTKFSHVKIDYPHACITFYEDAEDDEGHSFALQLTVAGPIV